jgi:hypothetical protein
MLPHTPPVTIEHLLLSLLSETLPFWANLTTSSVTKPARWQYLPGGYPKETDPSQVLGLTLDKVPNTLQSIHLHCFNGDEATVKL